MKRAISLGFLSLAAVVALPLVISSPSLAKWQEVGQAIAQQIRRPQVDLVLSAEKQVSTVDAKGQVQLTWETLEGTVTVQPGDTLRYTIASENDGEVPAKNLVITQPIPAQMQYVLNSAKGNNEAQITYSIDAGQTFVENPVVEVILPDGRVEWQAAPAEAYTHIRWDFAESLDPGVAVNVNYQVQVK